MMELELTWVFLLAGKFLCLERFHQNMLCLVCLEHFVNKLEIIEFWSMFVANTTLAMQLSDYKVEICQGSTFLF